jgi:hypothetical protein
MPATIHLDQDEIALFAYLAWERDGSPPDRSLQYWLDAEAQLRATRCSLVEELKSARVPQIKKVRKASSTRSGTTTRKSPRRATA